MYQNGWRERTLREVVKTAIDNHPDTTPDRPMGYSINDIYHKVIRFGQANFDESYENLSGAHRALLYALVNQPGHLTELDVAFGQIFASDRLPSDPFIFDLGCGPFTAGLSIANAFGPNTTFSYHGIDLYQSMRELGDRLAKAGQRHNGIHIDSEFTFHKSLEDVPRPPYARNNAKIFIASYLLASDTLSIDPLVQEIIKCADEFSWGPSMLLYTNSANENATTHYARFEEGLAKGGFVREAGGYSQVSHRGKARNLHYAFFRKPASVVFQKYH